jgi:hypothetical protein
MKSTKKLLEMLRDEAVEKLPMKDMGLCFLICNSTDKRKVSSKERDRLYMYILRNAPKDATLHAQQVAEKMVEEKLREELIAYDKWLISDDMGINYATTGECIDAYLKTRER